MKKKRNLFKAGPAVKLSMVIMGLGQLIQKQWIKGLVYLAVLGAYIGYLVTGGVQDAIGFFTLGTKKADPWLGTPGDDSIMMLLKGLLFYIITAIVVAIHIANIKDAYDSDEKLKAGIKLPGFIKSVGIFADKKFYILALSLLFRSASSSRDRGCHIRTFDSVPLSSRPIFLRCVHTRSMATTIEKTINETDVFSHPKRLYIPPENIDTKIGKHPPAIIEASDT